MNKRIFYFLAILIITLGAGCKDNASCTEADQEAQIQQYIKDNNLTTQKTSSGLHYIIEEPGSQVRPTSTSTVVVSYAGTLIDGSAFDASTRITFQLDQVIDGWTEGIPLFKKGGKGTLIIPCHLAYGEQAQSKIPAASVLIFEIELLDVF